jgi:hypothetical protein
MEALSELVDEIEAEQERGMVPAFKVFRSILNQPSLLTISSANAVNLSQSTNGFTTFQVNLPRPIFDVESIQLVNANLPQCSPNVPDTTCVFWYYRLSQYSGVVPNTNNLYYVRLLPSTYKPETILNSSNYGFNRTFVSYPDLATELALCCSNDLAYYNYSQCVSNYFYTDNQYTVNFIPSDISLTYNSRFNKFQMTGSNAFTQFATKGWASSNTYASNDIVYYSNAQSYPNLASYQSLVNANSNQNPFTATAYWKRVYTDIVRVYNSNTPYRQGAIVTNTTGTTLYQAQYQTIGLSYTNTPSTYSSSTAYGFGDLVTYLGTNYTNISPSSNVSPSNVSYWLPTAYSSGVSYPTGFVATYSSQYWVSIQPVLNRAPPNSAYWSNIGTGIWATYTTSTSNPNYRYLSAGFTDPNLNLNQGPVGIPNTQAYYSSEELNWSPYALYESGAVVRYNGVSYGANVQNLNYTPFDTAGATAWSSTRIYEAGVVVSFNTLYFLSSRRSQGQIPSIFSTYWTEQLWTPLIASDWVSTTTYGLGAMVRVNFNPAGSTPFYAVFLSLIAGNVGNNPLDANNNTNGYWRYNDAPTVSLNAVSSDFDIQEIFSSGSNTNLITRFPSGVSGQPFVSPPRRTLNSLMGFTWNGIMNPSSVSTATIQSITGTSYLIQTQSVDLFNRLRPIPDYTIVTTDSYSNVLLGANARTSTVTQVYTADGYANLNFSSIISLYTTIASASTMDTDRNTNLLATCPMNCVNLGVSFFEPKIANEILVRGVQLDTISISMFDEFGDAYVVTNNGVVTITLRLTYKDRLHIK